MRGDSNLVALLIAILIVIAVAIVVASVINMTELIRRAPSSKESLSTSATEAQVNLTEVGPNDVFIAVLVDNNPYRKGLRTTWGFAAFIEAYGRRILFDTGPDPKTLRYNAEALGIDLSKLDAVVISHEHGDHVGGLRYVTEVAGKVPTYIPSGASLDLWNIVANLGLKPVAVQSSTEIFPNIYVIGPLYGPPAEEALAINTRKGLVIVVGCSHPGIVNIVKKAMEVTGEKPYIVIGGFHLIGEDEAKVRAIVKELISLGVKKICATHCSGTYIRKYIEETYPSAYCPCGVGYEILLKNVKP